jgi:VanZ family protein
VVSRILSYGVSIALDVVWVAPLAFVASGVVIAHSIQRGADQDSIVDRLAAVWLVAALAAVALLTLQPRSGGFAPPRPSNFNPLRRPDIRDAVANVALFLPVGFFAAVRWRSKPRPVAWATGFALLISAGIELTQRVLPIDRAASIHDVLFNTIGGFFGAVGAMVVIELARRSGLYAFGDRVEV